MSGICSAHRHHDPDCPRCAVTATSGADRDSLNSCCGTPAACKYGRCPALHRLTPTPAETVAAQTIATSGADRPTLREQLDDVLATHVIVSLSGVVVRCSCGWDSTSRIIDGLARVSENRAHLADALLPVVERARFQAAAEALETLRANLLADEDARTDAALEGLDFTLDLLQHHAAALRSQGGGR